MKKVVVIGAGPAGLSCAYKLAKKKIDVEVFEASEHVGGMSRSFDLWDQRVDLGPHRFFSKQADINAFFKDLVKDDFTLVERQTRIFYNKRYFEYPLKFGNVLKNLSIFTIFQIIWGYFMQKLFPIKNPDNFADWVTSRFGKKLFSIFFKSYTEKLWGIPCEKIDADWAAQRIKTLSLFGAVVAAIFGNRGNKHKTLVDQFAYPKNGTGTLYNNASDSITENGGKVNLSTPIKRVVLDDTDKKVVGVELVNGTTIETDTVVSTMPMTRMVKSLNNVPQKVIDAADALYFRNTILVYLELDKKDLFTDNWLYIHSAQVKHGRITNFRNWCPSLTKGKDTTILCMEFWCFDQDATWTNPEEEIIALAKEEIYKIGLIPDSTEILNTKVIKIPMCYPVYETGYQKNLKVVIDYLKGIEGLIPIGRYGSFKYNNQDHSILMGLLAADRISDGKEVDLWQINTDTEYQEEGKIKDVLVQ